MRVDIVTLFPDMFDALTRYGVTGRAFERRLLRLICWNPRDFATDRHRTVDDRPFGGGPGMLMKTGPLLDCLAAARAGLEQEKTGQGATGQAASKRAADKADRAEKADQTREANKRNAPGRVVYLSPQGRRIDHAVVARLARQPQLILLCGRYRGIDQRVIDAAVDEELSLGDFVVSGGELAAMALLDAVIRLLPGTLGDGDSAEDESFADGLLLGPEYTRPREAVGVSVPEVLLSGDHGEVRRWRLQQKLGATWRKRPDLLAAREMTEEEQRLLAEYRAGKQEAGT